MELKEAVNEPPVARLAQREHGRRRTPAAPEVCLVAGPDAHVRTLAPGGAMVGEPGHLLTARSAGAGTCQYAHRVAALLFQCAGPARDLTRPLRLPSQAQPKV